MHKLTTLYARNKKGDIKFWRVYAEGSEYVVEYGLNGGKVTRKVTTAKAKNVGKSNETTPEQQAILEAQSKWNKKQLREGYVEDITLWGAMFYPQLAQNYDAKQATFMRLVKAIIEERSQGFYVQPKLDGVRAFWEMGVMLSRKRDLYTAPSHIFSELDNFAKCLAKVAGVGYNSLSVDGELYKHGMLRQTISGAVKKLRKETLQLQFHIFDFYSSEAPDLTFGERFEMIFQAYMMVTNKSTLRLVDTELMSPQTSVGITKLLLTKMQEYVDAGYEGMMVRFNEAYQPDCRTSFLWKFKLFMEEEFEIVDVKETKPIRKEVKNPKEPLDQYVVVDGRYYSETVQGLFVVLLNDGQTTDVRPIGTNEFREEIVLQPAKFIGKKLTTVFQGYLKDGDLEFARGVEVRHDIV